MLAFNSKNKSQIANINKPIYYVFMKSISVFIVIYSMFLSFYTTLEIGQKIISYIETLDDYYQYCLFDKKSKTFLSKKSKKRKFIHKRTIPVNNLTLIEELEQEYQRAGKKDSQDHKDRLSTPGNQLQDLERLTRPGLYHRFQQYQLPQKFHKAAVRLQPENRLCLGRFCRITAPLSSSPCLHSLWHHHLKLG